MASSSPAPYRENDQPSPAISGYDASEDITSSENTDDSASVDIAGGDSIAIVDITRQESRKRKRNEIEMNMAMLRIKESAVSAENDQPAPDISGYDAGDEVTSSNNTVIGGNNTGGDNSGGQKKSVTLRTKDDKLVEMEEGAAKLSGVLRRQIEEGFVGDAIPVDVKKKTLKKVRAYCDAHARWASWPPEVVKEKMKESFDDELAETFDFAKRFFMFQAAIYLEIIELIDLLGETLAAKMRGKSTDELLSMIKKDNELTHEEEEQVLKDLLRIIG